MAADEPPTIEEQLTLAHELERERRELAGDAADHPPEAGDAGSAESSHASNV